MKKIKYNSPPAPAVLPPLFLKERGDGPERDIGVS